MRKLRPSFLAGATGVIALAGTAVLASPVSAGVAGTYQFGQNGQFPVGTMTFTKPDQFSDMFINGITDTGTWHRNVNVVKIKITTSSDPYDIGCILKGTVTTTGIGSASAPGDYQCPSGSGTWYAVKNTGTTASTAAGTSGSHSWFQG